MVIWSLLFFWSVIINLDLVLSFITEYVSLILGFSLNKQGGLCCVYFKHDRCLCFSLIEKKGEGGVKKCYEASLSGCCAIIVVL